jgi:preprotein translocase subunit SecF
MQVKVWDFASFKSGTNSCRRYQNERLLGCSWSYGDVFLYLMISFRKWQYSLGAIAAVAHDVIFV